MAKIKAIKDIKIELFVVCDYAIIGKDSKLSIMGIFDRISSKQFPVKYPRLCVSAMFNGEPESTHLIKLVLENQVDKRVIKETKNEVSLGSSGRAKLVAKFSNINFENPGSYIFKIASADKVFGEAVLNLVRKNTIEEKPKPKYIN